MYVEERKPEKLRISVKHFSRPCKTTSTLTILVYMLHNKIWNNECAVLDDPGLSDLLITGIEEPFIRCLNTSIGLPICTGLLLIILLLYINIVIIIIYYHQYHTL
jgi:hypothetical protein